MKLISIDVGRVTWLFPVEEILPIGGAEGPNIVQAIASRYAFTQSPSNPTREDIDKNGLKFLAGHFEHEKNRANITEFAVFNDGIVVSSVSTEAAEAFFEDVYAFLRSNFGFREIVSTVKRVYLSNLVVELGPSLSKALDSYAQIAKVIGEKLNKLDGSKHPVELARLDFALNKDPEFRPPNIPRFTIEKRAHAPFSQHRYFSSAPIPTKDHLTMLEHLEKLWK
jgi:hypothetical protein